MSRRRLAVVVAALGSVSLLAAACSASTSSSARQAKTARSTPAGATAPSTTASSTTTTTTVPLDFHRPLAPTRPLRVLVVGDSVGISLAVGLEQWARDTGKAVVRDASRAWCSLGRFLPRNVYGPQNAGAGCDDWGTRWANEIATFDPDVVFVMFSVWEVVPRQLPGMTTFVRPGNPALDAWQLAEYQNAADVLSARGARVVWFSTACERATRIKRGEPYWYVNRRTIPALARSRPSVRLIDLDGFLCNGPHLVNDLGGVKNIRPDDAHYSPAGALALSRWLMPIVLGTAPPPPYAKN